jgi:hypothetical protein
MGIQERGYSPTGIQEKVSRRGKELQVIEFLFQKRVKGKEVWHSLLPSSIAILVLHILSTSPFTLHSSYFTLPLTVVPLI